MEGYFKSDETGKGKRVPTGRLRISVRNLSEFNELIEKARKEADQLQHTISQLERFELTIDFDADIKQIASEIASHR